MASQVLFKRYRCSEFSRSAFPFLMGYLLLPVSSQTTRLHVGLLKLSLLANENGHPQMPARQRTYISFRASDRRSTKAHNKHDGLPETYSGTPSARSG